MRLHSRTACRHLTVRSGEGDPGRLPGFADTWLATAAPRSGSPLLRELITFDLVDLSSGEPRGPLGN